MTTHDVTADAILEKPSSGFELRGIDGNHPTQCEA